MARYLNGKCALNNACHVLDDQPARAPWTFIVHSSVKLDPGLTAGFMRAGRRSCPQTGWIWCRRAPIGLRSWSYIQYSQRVLSGQSGSCVCVFLSLPLLVAMLRWRICSTLTAMSDMFWAMACIRSTSPIGWILVRTNMWTYKKKRTSKRIAATVL